MPKTKKAVKAKAPKAKAKPKKTETVAEKKRRLFGDLTKIRYPMAPEPE